MTFEPAPASAMRRCAAGLLLAQGSRQRVTAQVWLSLRRNLNSDERLAEARPVPRQGRLDDDCGALASDARNRLQSDRDHRCQDGRRHCPFVAARGAMTRLLRRELGGPKQNFGPWRSRPAARLRFRESRCLRESSDAPGKDRGIAPETPDRAVDPEEEFPRQLRDGHDPLQRVQRALGRLPVNITTVPDTMISGPPTRPSHVALRGTRPELYIR